MLIKGSSSKKVTRILSNNYHSIYAKLVELLTDKNAALANFFGEPVDSYKNTLDWELKIPNASEGIIKSITELEAVEKNQALDCLEAVKKEISEILSQDSYFKDIHLKIFDTPTDEDIKVLISGSDINVFLIQWGHRLLDDDAKISPLTRLLNIPRPNRAKVIVKISYSDGSIANEKSFWVKYGNVIKEFTTDVSGERDLGYYKLDSEIVVYDLDDEGGKFEHSFLVSEGEEYDVTFPLLADVQFKVINQNQENIPDIEVIINYNNEEISKNTGINGVLELRNLEVAKDINFRLSEGSDIDKSFVIQKTKNVFVIELLEPVYSTSILKLINQKKEIIPNQSVFIEYKNKQNKYESNEDGIINLSAFEIDNTINVKEIDRELNNQNYSITQSSEQFIFEIEVLEPQLVKILLVDKKDVPIPNTKIEFKSGEKVESKVTDKNGSCVLSSDFFIDDGKVEALVSLIEKNKNGEDSVKKIKKRFKFKRETLDYTIKIKPINKKRLLWLLLLLLFIPYKKEVCVMVFDGQTQVRVPNNRVSFFYNRQFSYSIDTLRQETDSLGFARFVELKTSGASFLYSFLTNTKAIVSASNSNCFGADTAHYRFHNLIYLSDTIRLSLNPIRVSTDFKVIDKVDSEPLPDATVILESVYLGRTYIDSAISDANGRVVFDGVYKCGVIKRIFGSLYGYLPDSIVNKTFEELNNTRALSLEPKTNRITFFVEDCLTQRRIPGALVTIDIKNGKSKTTQNIHTNVNGIGKGFYENAHIISEISLIGEHHPFYDKGTLPTHLVKDFITLPDSLRTICLPPKPNQVTFKNIDNYSQTGLAGVTNRILVRKLGKQENYILTSDASGDFVFNISVNDTVTVISTYPPDYEDNTTKIVRVLGLKLIKGIKENRIIPLEPKMVDLPFRIVEEDNIDEMVPNSNIRTELLVNGKSMSLAMPNQSDINGEFILRLPVTALISITASKAGYSSNNTKVQSVPIRRLIASHQIERDIPLKKEPPPCNTKQGAGNTANMNSYNMGDKNFKFTIEYNMNSIEDQMIVYCGHKDNLGPILNKTLGKVEYSQGSPLDIDLNQCNQDGWITIEIITGGTSTSEWEYSIVCP